MMNGTDPEHRTRCIEIPEPTADALALRLEGTEFETVDEYVAFALEQLLDQLHRHDTVTCTEEASEELAANGQNDASVEDRLESLGYL